MHVSAHHCLAPIGRQGFRSSVYLQETACFIGQQLPFDEASETLQRLAGIDLSDKQIERICHAYGEVLEEELYEDKVVSESIAPVSTQYVLMDGSMVLLRKEPAAGTQAGWREVKLARIFAASDLVPIKKRTLIRHSDYVLHLGDSTDFCKKVSTRLRPAQSLIALGDGARWIWDYWDTFYPQAVQILDYYHVVEKLGDWARVHFKAGPACQAWMEEAEKLLRSDEVVQLLRKLMLLDCSGESARLQEALQTYLTNNQHRMQYGTYLSKGYLIGSGAIESANREVVQSRLKRSGQRWTQAGLQQVGNLRVAYKSERWQLVREAIRNAA